MQILAKKSEISDSAEFGDDVKIEAEYVKIGDDVKIGVKTDNNFRAVAGVRIRAKRLVVESNSVIDREVMIRGGEISIGRSCRIMDGCTIDVVKKFVIGDRVRFGKSCSVEGYDIEIGNDLWMRNYVQIGGGMCREPQSSLRIGDFCHIGDYAYINTARPVKIGNEVGIGLRSSILTHGIYLSALDGFPAKFAPVEIEDRCWLPNAIVNPGVKIRHDSVIAGGSVVTKDVPESSLVAGIPARVVKENVFPAKFDKDSTIEVVYNLMKMLGEIKSANLERDGDILRIRLNNSDIIYKYELNKPAIKGRRTLVISNVVTSFDFDKNSVTVFDINRRKIYGCADETSDLVFDHLRRFGIRFRYIPKNGFYVNWDQLD